MISVKNPYMKSYKQERISIIKLMAGISKKADKNRSACIKFKMSLTDLYQAGFLVE